MSREEALRLVEPFLTVRGLVPDPSIVWENTEVYVIGYGLPGWVNNHDPADMIVDDRILVIYKATEVVQFENDDLQNPPHAGLVEVAA